MGDALDACSECGGELDRLGGAEAGPAVFACRRCGRRLHAELQPSLPPAPPEPRFRVLVEWSDPPGPELVRALRALDPRLGRRSVREVWDHLHARRGWDLGVHASEAAQRLERRCRSLGLDAAFRTATSDEEGGSEPPGPPAERVDRGVPIHFAWIVLAGAALLGASALLLC